MPSGNGIFSAGHEDRQYQLEGLRKVSVGNRKGNPFTANPGSEAEVRALPFPVWEGTDVEVTVDAVGGGGPVTLDSLGRREVAGEELRAG